MTHEDKIIEELDKVLPDLWLDLEKDDVQEILKPTLYKEELWVESQLEISEDKLKDWLRQTLTTYRAQVLDEAKWHVLVSDNSGHEYVIPQEKQEEWDAFMEIPEDDERSWDVPEWAEQKEGYFRFKQFQTDPY